VLSPLLFNIFLDWIKRKALKAVGSTGIKIRFAKNGKFIHLKKKEMTEMTMINLLMYADDMVLMDDDLERLEKVLNELDTQLLNAGMMMNVKKTKLMALNGEIKDPMVIRGERIEVEESFTYLGANIRARDALAAEEVATRISKAGKLFSGLYHQLWKWKQISISTKVDIYRGAILPVLLYGSETWVLSLKEMKRLEKFHMKCLRTILGITMFDHKRNEDIRAETFQVTIAEMLTRTRLRWLGHVARMTDDRLPLQIFYASLDKGKSERRRPERRWKDMIQTDLNERKVTSWYDLAKDRNLWRKVVKGDVVSAKERRIMKNDKKQKNEDIPTSTPTFKCPSCDKVLRSKTWLTRHWKDEHSSELLAGLINHTG
jgi:hypothetical protein